MNHKVLSIALQGCGIDPEVYRDSVTYKELLTEEALLRFRLLRGSDEWLAYRAGSLRFGSALHRRQPSDVLALSIARRMKALKQNPRRRTEIRYLGRAVLARAKKHLENNVLALWFSIWSVSSTEEQLNNLANITAFLREIDQLQSTLLESLRSQRPENALPEHYVPSAKAPTEVPRPNCLGKAQLLAAFFRKAGLKVWAFSPVVTAQRSFKTAQAEIARSILDETSEENGGWNCERISAGSVAELLAIEREAIALRELPAYQHTGLIVELTDGRLLMFDPNHEISAILPPEQSGLSQALALAEKYREVTPGLTIPIQFPQFEHTLQRHKADFETLRVLAKKADQLVRVENRGLLDVVEWMAENPEVLEALRPLRSDDAAKAKEEDEFYFRMSPIAKAIFVALRGAEITKRASSRLAEFQESYPKHSAATREEDLAVLAALSPEHIKDWDKGRDFPELVAVDRAAPILDRLKVLASRILKAGLAPLQEFRDATVATTPHPVIQLYADLEFALGVATLGHVGVTTGRWKSTERSLVPESSCLFRLHNHLLAHTQGRRPTAQTLRTVEVLRSCSFPLPETEAILSAFCSAFCFPTPVHERTDSHGPEEAPEEGPAEGIEDVGTEGQEARRQEDSRDEFDSGGRNPGARSGRGCHDDPRSVRRPDGAGHSDDHRLDTPAH